MFSKRQTILMCAPDFFDVNYVINPWMQNQIGKVDHALATQQWKRLHDALAQYATIALMPPKPGVPDLVFTANAGFVLGRQAIISKFRTPEREPEEPINLQWFKDNRFTIAEWPPIVPFEGAGDAFARPRPAGDLDRQRLPFRHYGTGLCRGHYRTPYRDAQADRSAFLSS